MGVSYRETGGSWRETHLVTEDIYNTIQGSLHLGQAYENSLSYALNHSRNAVAINDCLYTRSIGGLRGYNSSNGGSTLVGIKGERQRCVHQAE